MNALADYLLQRGAELGVTTTIRGLAKRTGVPIATMHGILVSNATPQEQTLERIADGLPAPLQLLRRLADLPAGEREPFVLPPEANQLDQRQREVVLAMVRALLDASARATAVEQAGRGLRLAGRTRDADMPPNEAHPDGVRDRK